MVFGRVAAIFFFRSHSSIEQILIFHFSLFFPNYSKLGTHGTPKRRGAGHEPPVKSLTYGDVKRPVSGMHSTENVAGK